jgi:hypothetical protein
MLAYKLGFDADTVWNDPKNQQLRDAGGNAPPSAPDPDTSQSSSAATSASVPDNGGLNDDGTLDDETKALLLKVHGS